MNALLPTLFSFFVPICGTFLTAFYGLYSRQYKTLAFIYTWRLLYRISWIYHYRHPCSLILVTFFTYGCFLSILHIITPEKVFHYQCRPSFWPLHSLYYIDPSFSVWKIKWVISSSLTFVPIFGKNIRLGSFTEDQGKITVIIIPCEQSE